SELVEHTAAWCCRYSRTPGARCSGARTDTPAAGAAWQRSCCASRESHGPPPLATQCHFSQQLHHFASETDRRFRVAWCNGGLGHRRRKRSPRFHPIGKTCRQKQG